MSREGKARIATIFVLVAVVAVVVIREAGVPFSLDARTSPSPRDAIYAMFDAGKAGDVQRYLSCYSGAMEQALDRARNESADFAQYLRDSNVGLKGIAVMEPELQSDWEAKVRVEYIYQDRNEAQIFSLEKGSRGWKISRVEPAERVKTLVPYGTPVQ
jgi:hypothetical protein